ncbi:MAG: hypothetical protein EXS10_07110 [Phycisphaerales bacterium]|nr:hypothetical protein [Phycisphaerales bacterium]
MNINRTARSSLTVIAAASANLFVVGAALAAGIGAVTALVGAPFVVVSVSQVTSIAQVVGSRVEVSYAATPTFVAPPFVGYFPAAVGTTSTLNGPGFSLICDHAGANPTFRLTHSGAVGYNIVELRLIGLNNVGGKKYCFDRTFPNPGTAQSLNGADIVYLGGVGTWLAGPEYSNRVNLVGVAPQNDTYMKLRVKFSTSFVPTNVLAFGLDIDRIN